VNGLAGWTLSLAGGTVLWSLATVSTGSREPWDSPAYWTVWLPCAVLLAALLGFAFPQRPWRWPIAVMLAQLPVMALVSGEVGSLAPLGAILLLFLSIPGMAAAALAAWVRRRLGTGASA
jgi:hypothetical protein